MKGNRKTVIRENCGRKEGNDTSDMPERMSSGSKRYRKRKTRDRAIRGKKWRV